MKIETNDELHNNRTSDYVTQTEKQLVPKYEFQQQSTAVHCNSSSEDYGQLQNRNNLISEDNIISNSSVNKNSGYFQSKSLNLVLPSRFANNNPLNDCVQYECSDTKSNHNKRNMKCDRSYT